MYDSADEVEEGVNEALQADFCISTVYTVLMRYHCCTAHRNGYCCDYQELMWIELSEG